ncbi:uncharacterized protein K489DRAFT_197360 [Dissoconium aciculare CBS 342.82]|uniref:Uncharacterized protein n=1 Tax=Dissoconium aciculare CBS 342.82 TaxID=1314786 RepID=A0A6J3M634_9PEZI|nr:uncharacterized protein K489DRAFT_197360 [Dissoconium aciculare CBS 342.82]KAF1823490.1 hypothetical protein K489DRAFT_197360 [Dissoconium aciculare CBS 342.82]
MGGGGGTSDPIPSLLFPVFVPCCSISAHARAAHLQQVRPVHPHPPTHTRSRGRLESMVRCVNGKCRQQRLASTFAVVCTIFIAASESGRVYCTRTIDGWRRRRVHADNTFFDNYRYPLRLD